MIELRNIKKEYMTKQKTYPVFSDLNIDIKQQEKVCIIGESGIGKTTLLNIIGCMDKNFSGEYLLNGKNVLQLSNKEVANLRNKTFGFIMQHYGLISEDTAIYNVMLPLIISSSLKKKEQISRAEQTLCDLNIIDLKDKKVNELSSGQKQRVAIAKAIVNDADIIICDEPTSSLDNKTKEDIINVILGLNEKGKTIIMSTHDDFVIKKFDRIIDLKVYSSKSKGDM